jgi:hypothetical protein
MIILFAMVNSLAAHESALRAAIGPPDCATWGVYVGGGKIGNRDGEPRGGELCSRITAKRPRRTSGGRRGVDLPSGHSQPETKRASHAALQGNAGRRRCHDFDPSRAAGPNLAGSSLPLACDLRADSSPRMESGKAPDGSITRPGLFVQPAGHRLMVPVKRLTQLLSEPAARTRSEFATQRK